MKRIIAILMAAMMVAALTVGCGKDNSSSAPSTPDSSMSGSASGESSAPEEIQPTLEEVHTAVKNAYGDNYLPNMPMDETALTEMVGVNMENVEEFIAESPMISAQVDTFIAIKAKEGKGEEVEKELNAYRDKLVNDSFQYPMNMPKVNASQVIRKGDYVFFVMLGAINDAMDVTEEEAAKFAQEQIQIGVDAIEAVFAGEEPPVAPKAENEMADDVSDAVSDAGDAVSDAGDAVSDAVSDAGNAVSEAVSDAGEAVSNATSGN